MWFFFWPPGSFALNAMIESDRMSLVRQPWVVLGSGVPAVPEYYEREACWPAASLARRRVMLAQVRVADLAGPEIRALLELGPQHGEIKSMQRTL